MMYCIVGKCGANVDVNENRGTVFVQCSRGRGMQCGSNDRFYPEELCQGCDLSPSSHYFDNYSDDDEYDYEDDEDIVCFE